MLSIEWTASAGWLPPRITPYQNLSLDPATCVLHYAFTAFEGMKAYKSPLDDSLRLFRPMMNMTRMNKSAARIALPKFSHEGMIELLSQFLRLEERFIPKYVLLVCSATSKTGSFMPQPMLTFPKVHQATPSTSAPP